jgi:hypothetical protein
MREAFKSEKASARGKTKTGVAGRASMDTAEKEQDHQAQLDQVQVTMPPVRERNRGQYRSVNIEQQSQPSKRSNGAPTLTTMKSMNAGRMLRPGQGMKATRIAGGAESPSQ